MRVIELRNYLLKDGATGDFIRYFEEHFLFSQREEGMHVLPPPGGQHRLRR